METPPLNRNNVELFRSIYPQTRGGVLRVLGYLVENNLLEDAYGIDFGLFCYLVTATDRDLISAVEKGFVKFYPEQSFLEIGRMRGLWVSREGIQAPRYSRLKRLFVPQHRVWFPEYLRLYFGGDDIKAFKMNMWVGTTEPIVGMYAKRIGKLSPFGPGRVGLMLERLVARVNTPMARIEFQGAVIDGEKWELGVSISRPLPPGFSLH